MLGSTLFYGGAVMAAAGSLLSIRPSVRMGISTRRRAVILGACGVGVAGGALLLPVAESRVPRVATRLDEFAPAWQFREFHSRRVAAPPAVVYAALRRVRADDIWLFETLTWIRRGGRPLPPGILNAGSERPIIDVALSGGFVLLADDVPRELLLAVVVDAPDGAPRKASADVIRHPPPGYSVAAMNFLVSADGDTGSVVSTETRVFSSGDEARRRFAKYWRVIYPGSALIRRMWLRAVDRRTNESPAK